MKDPVELENEFYNERKWYVSNEDSDFKNSVADVFEQLQLDIHQNAKHKGWWETPREVGTLMMLMVSELAEAFEGHREHNPASEKIPLFCIEEEELADTIIRILDYAEYKEYDIGAAILAKMEYNTGRSYRHGGKLA